jgi:hypothetical protein
LQKQADIWLATVVIVIFAAMLSYVGYRQPYNFDACFNMISYQSLFDGQGFQRTYNEKMIVFDPWISTGPEMYIPTFFIWSLIKNTKYAVSVFVLISYYVIFLVFLISVVFKNISHKTIVVLAFIILVFINSNLINVPWVLITPLGEPVAAMLVYCGFFFLVTHKSKVIGLCILGLAFDVKQNVALGLFITLGIYYILNNYKYFSTASPFVSISLIINIIMSLFFVVSPYLLSVKIIPLMVMGPEERKEWNEENIARDKYLVARGFGHTLNVISKPTKENLDEFLQRSKNKFHEIVRFHGGYKILFIAFVALWLFMLMYTMKKRHFAFYLFAFYGNSSLWWFFCPTDAWYRYYSIGDLVFTFGVISVLPDIIISLKRLPVLLIITAVLVCYVPRFSMSSYQEYFKMNHKNDAERMAADLMQLNEKQVFGYGWFQLPQLMFLTHKRFLDITDSYQFERAKKLFWNMYFISTPEMVTEPFIVNKISELSSVLEPLKSYGHFTMYEIKYMRDPDLMSVENWCFHCPNSIYNNLAEFSLIMVKAKGLKMDTQIVWDKIPCNSVVDMSSNTIVAWVPYSPNSSIGVHELFLRSNSSQFCSKPVLINAEGICSGTVDEQSN